MVYMPASSARTPSVTSGLRMSFYICSIALFYTKLWLSSIETDVFVHSQELKNFFNEKVTKKIVCSSFRREEQGHISRSEFPSSNLKNEETLQGITTYCLKITGMHNQSVR